jgi:hypothetical protein
MFGRPPPGGGRFLSMGGHDQSRDNPRWHANNNVLQRFLASSARVNALDGLSSSGSAEEARSFTLSVFTLVPVRPRSRCELHSLRTFSPSARVSPPATPRFRSRHTSTPFNSISDAFQLHPDVGRFARTVDAQILTGTEETPLFTIYSTAFPASMTPPTWKPPPPPPKPPPKPKPTGRGGELGVGVSRESATAVRGS